MFEYNFHWRPVFRSLPDLLEASLTTLQVASLAMLLGIIIGFILAVSRLRGSGAIYWIATAWVELARNTPALFQLFFFGFGLGALGIHFSPYVIVLAGLTSRPWSFGRLFLFGTSSPGSLPPSWLAGTWY